MSNYIKIEMEGGTTLTGTLTPEGGGTISGYDARNGVGIFTSSGQGSGATCNVTLGGRSLDATSVALLDGSNYGDDFVDTAGTSAGLVAASGS